MGFHTTTHPRSSSRAMPLAIALLALATLVTPTGCGLSSGWQREPEPRDLLTDVADDGSLSRGLSHPDPSVRRLSARALGRLPADGNVGHVLSAASSEVDSDALVEICFTLGQWRAAEAETFLAQMAEHDRAAVRAAAILALGKLGDDTLTGLAVAALGDPNPEVRQAAALALFRLDGRRYDHPRQADEAALIARDTALARAALKDPDEGVRWRATYALANIRNRPGLPTVLARCARDPRTPLSRVFALRGLGSLQPAAPDIALSEARRHLADEDPRVVLEAASLVARFGPFDETLALTANPSTNVRMVALDGLRRRALGPSGDALMPVGETTWVQPLLSTCEGLLENDPSAAIRREVRALLIAVATLETVQTEQAVESTWTGVVTSQDPLARLQAAALKARQALAVSEEPRDRERLARLIADDELEDRALLNQLLEDKVPSVVAVALEALASRDVATLYHDRERFLEALSDPDPAIRGTVAEMMGPLIREGNAPPWLVSAVADSLQQVSELEPAQRLEMEETRANLARALGLPKLDPLPPGDPPRGPLLDRLLQERAEAERDASPVVVIETSRGDVRVVLDRLAAPRHVESFLELADDGFYDGLDIHRVVPNFVVQGLDPRHDGWGIGGRRVPDEFGPDAYLTGSLGMPNAGSPQSGGCQIFITHVPTPHLDGAYTHFGRVVQGMDVVAALEIGDVIKSVERVPGNASDSSGTHDWLGGS